MASLVSGDTPFDRLVRIQAWRDEAVSHGPAQDASIATRIFIDCITCYRQCLREISSKTALPKAYHTKLIRSYEAFALWAHVYDIAHGLSLRSSSQMTRRCC